MSEENSFYGIHWYSAVGAVVDYPSRAWPALSLALLCAEFDEERALGRIRPHEAFFQRGFYIAGCGFIPRAEEPSDSCDSCGATEELHTDHMGTHCPRCHFIKRND